MAMSLVCSFFWHTLYSLGAATLFDSVIVYNSSKLFTGGEVCHLQCNFATVGEPSIAMSVSVRVFVCPRAYLQNHKADRRRFLCVLLMVVARPSRCGVAIWVKWMDGWSKV